MTKDDTDDQLLAVARDLRQIEVLDLDLAAHAIGRSAHRDMPGGPGMVMLAPDANLEAWEHRIEAAEEAHYEWCARDTHRDCRIADHVQDHDEAIEPPLQTLLFWSEQWRTEHGRELDTRPTIASEAGFLRRVLEWAWSHEPRFDDFAADVRQARYRIENLLRAGHRAHRTRVPCNQPGCTSTPRLVKVYAAEARNDHYRCPGCKHRYNEGEFERAYAAQLRSEGAERYVPKVDAVHTLRGLQRSERTIRSWFAPAERVADRCTECGVEQEPQEHAACPEEYDIDDVCGGALVAVWDDLEAVVEGWCDLATRQVWVWWPTLWRLHRSTATRRRSA